MACHNSGEKPGDEEVHLTVFDRWKTEISAVLVIGLWVLVTCIVIAAGTTFGGITDLSSAAGYYAEAYGVETIPVVYSALFTTAIDMVDLAGLFFYGLFTFLCFFAGYVSLSAGSRRRSSGKAACSVH